MRPFTFMIIFTAGFITGSTVMYHQATIKSIIWHQDDGVIARNWTHDEGIMNPQDPYRNHMMIPLYSADKGCILATTKDTNHGVDFDINWECIKATVDESVDNDDAVHELAKKLWAREKELEYAP